VPYYIDIERRFVVFRGEKFAQAGEVVVDGETSWACRLVDGQALSEEQIEALRNGSPAAFHSAAPPRALGADPSLPQQYVARGAVTQSSSSSSGGPRSRARSAAIVAEIIGWIVGVAGVIGGLIIARTPDESGWDTTYPFVGVGLGISFAALAQASLLIMVSAFVQWRVSPDAQRS
jgi:hypothetical protein